MVQARKPLVIVAGLFSLFAAVVMLAMAGLMYALETPLATCALIGSFSAVPLLVVVACFLPKRRTIALRILGLMVCLISAATLFQVLTGNAPSNGSRGRQLGMLVILTIGSGLMAWKGRWPGAEQDDASPEANAAT